jgi:hypothetical protein
MTSNVQRHQRTGAAVTTTPETVQARPGRSPAQINAEQKAMAERNRQSARGTVIPTGPAATVPATTGAAPAPALPDTRTPEQAFFDEGAPSTMFDGRLCKYDNKVPRYFTIDDDAVIADGIIFAAQCDQLVWGRVRFNGPGNPPTRYLGPKYDGYVPPPREDLGDPEDTWEIGISGRPEDPWQIHYYLPVENTETHGARPALTLRVAQSAGC